MFISLSMNIMQIGKITKHALQSGDAYHLSKVIGDWIMQAKTPPDIIRMQKKTRSNLIIKLGCPRSFQLVKQYWPCGTINNQRISSSIMKISLYQLVKNASFKFYHIVFTFVGAVPTYLDI